MPAAEAAAEMVRLGVLKETLQGNSGVLPWVVVLSLGVRKAGSRESSPRGVRTCEPLFERVGDNSDWKHGVVLS